MVRLPEARHRHQQCFFECCDDGHDGGHEEARLAVILVDACAGVDSRYVIWCRCVHTYGSNRCTSMKVIGSSNVSSDMCATGIAGVAKAQDTFAGSAETYSAEGKLMRWRMLNTKRV